MRPLAVNLGALAAAVGVVLALVLALTPAPRERLVDGYVLFVGGLLLFGLVQATRVASAGDADAQVDWNRERAPRRDERPRGLLKLEREVALASTNAFDLHFRLRPVLREVAAHRLAIARGLDLDSGSREVRDAVGPELWELVRPDREPPADRFAPGLPLERLRAALDVLERI